ncbi:MAG: hypothetical protein Q9M18_08690, partial [Mariprofundaceae bacterium]|nr:hypothetical protein [Mariprofundaceae bacterium]
MPNSGVYHRYNLNLPELSADTLMRLSGPSQQHIYRIEDALDIDIMGQPGSWQIEGRQAEFGAQALRALASLACTISPSKADVEQILRTLRYKKDNKEIISQKNIILKAGRRN